MSFYFCHIVFVSKLNYINNLIWRLGIGNSLGNAMNVYTTVEANENLDNRNSVLCSIWKFDERWKHGSSSSLWIPYLQITTICSISRSFPHSWLITRFVTRLTRWVPLVEQELLPFLSTWVHPRFLVGFMSLDL